MGCRNGALLTRIAWWSADPPSAVCPIRPSSACRSYDGHALVVDPHHRVADTQRVLAFSAIAGRVRAALALEVVEAEALLGGDDALLYGQLHEALPRAVQARLQQGLAVVGDEDHALLRTHGDRHASAFDDGAPADQRRIPRGPEPRGPLDQVVAAALAPVG